MKKRTDTYRLYWLRKKHLTEITGYFQKVVLI